MNEDEVISQIIKSLSEYNLRDIREINKSELDFTIAEFILCSCFIDQISGFRYNTSKVGERYRQFVSNYLPAYKPHELYKDLRNKLVHNYSIGSFYGITRRTSALHLKVVNRITVLNLENFILDLQQALDKYISELKNDATIRANAMAWYSKHKIMSLIS